MRRKIVKQGTSTLTISLPSSWTHRFNLSGDEELDLEDKGDELVIRTTNPVTGPFTRLDAQALGRLTNRSILNAYQLGFDTIELSKKDDLSNPESTRIISELLGFEITAQSGSTIVLKDVTATAPKEFSSMLRRLFLQLKTLLEEGHIALAQHNQESLQHLAARDKEINRLTNTCLRQITKHGYAEDQKRSYALFMSVHRLEEISDLLKVLFSEVARGNQVSPAFNDLYSDISSLFASCYNFMYQLTPANALDVSTKFDLLKVKITTHGSQKQGELPLMYLLSTICQHIVSIQGCHLGLLGNNQ